MFCATIMNFLALLEPLAAEGGALGARLPLLAVAPFALLLLCIAILPLLTPHWWHSNTNRALVAALLSVPFAAWLYLTEGAASLPAFEHAALDYVSFIVLLAALYIVSGGIFVRGSLNGTPLSNTTLLLIGAVLANLIGTTGASMVLIRPLIRANQSRTDKVHTIIFFIFIVSNCGGLLTPFADPPLYLGFLKGVPFTWTLQLWPEWLIVNGALLFTYFGLDSYRIDREEKARPGSQLEDAMKHEPIGLDGSHNVIFLLAIVGIILAKGTGLGSGGQEWKFGVQEGLMALVALLSYATTKRAVHAKNSFSFVPINEVAILFAGIFITMIAPLAILNSRGAELGLVHPWQYFWATGGLSGFLDNAPTYLTFAAVACGQAGISVEGSRYLAEYLAAVPSDALILKAISCGAVMMGAMTYIGNGPNFMVKAIAEENGIKMPSFFGYMGWSIMLLIPCMLIITFVFFR
ncbi:MAG: sodium:proton antiporter [Planctomycetes bacterium]|nr:sodium:proton antiporter [Planctomycetota bacterium]